MANAKMAFLNQNVARKSEKHQLTAIQSVGGSKLGDYANALQGLSTGEKNRFERYFWEILNHSDVWDFLHETADETSVVGGRKAIILWENESGQLANLADSLKHLNHAVQSWRRGKPYWNAPGVTINRMGSLNRTLYSGDKFSADIGVISPKRPEYLGAVYSFA